MQLKNYNVYFFFVVLIGITFLAYFILKPFLVPFLIAAILAHLFGFIYRAFIKITGKRKVISSILTCLIIALIILIPVIFISTLVVQEVQSMIVYFSDNSNPIMDIISKTKSNLAALPLARFINAEKLINEDAIINAVKNISQNALFILQSTYQGVAHIMFVTFATFFSLFYLFMDGEKLIKRIMKLSPLKDSYENILIERFNSIVRATIKGSSLLAIIQGFLGGAVFLVTGVASPILLGILMTITSVIPPIGSALVWLPVGIVMILLGHTMQGIIILIFGGLVISSLDNILRPKLVGKDTEMHPLMIIFSTLGGLALFGISGFIVGPVVMSLFVALWDIYYLEFRGQLKEFNK